MLKKRRRTRLKSAKSLARTKGIFGFFKTEYQPKSAGTIESISNVTGQTHHSRRAVARFKCARISPARSSKSFRKKAVVIEAESTFVQGIFGIGGEAFGPIRMACSSRDAGADADHDHAGDARRDRRRRRADDGRGHAQGDRGRRRRRSFPAAWTIRTSRHSRLRPGRGDHRLGADRHRRSSSPKASARSRWRSGRSSCSRRMRADSRGQRRNADSRASCGRRSSSRSREAERVRSKARTGTAAGTLEIGTPVRIIRDPYFGVIGPGRRACRRSRAC